MAIIRSTKTVHFWYSLVRDLYHPTFTSFETGFDYYVYDGTTIAAPQL